MNPYEMKRSGGAIENSVQVDKDFEVCETE